MDPAVMIADPRPADADDDAEAVLVVDLDGTLCRTDTLHETLLRLAAADPRAMPGMALGLRGGKVRFKNAIADRMVIDPATLGYDPAVIEALERARAAGRRTALVSASDRRVAEAVAAHLGLFDEVHGTDPDGRGPNLSGHAKADFLVRRFGDRGFDYIGDCRADLPVWQKARTALAVRPDAALIRAGQAGGISLQPVGQADPALRRRAMIRALRPHQWSKNILVFLPMLAAQDFSALPLVLLAFVLFCLIASSVYIINDLLDLPADRIHPRKSRRPFASGAVPAATGMAMAAIMLGISLLLGLIVMPGAFMGVMAGYFLLTLAYSLSLKRKLIVDVVTLAILYTLRIIAGAAAAGISPSPWLLAFSVFLFFGLAAIKRQAELIDQIARDRPDSPGRAYLSGDVTVMQIMAISSGQAAVMVFALYLDSQTATALYARPQILWLICPILLYWLSRIAILTHRGHMEDDPIVFAARDRVSQITGLVVLILLLAAARG
ncbi:MAG: UbiA family prenyltransferase [Paracoccus sp. (in: a-proteobacteria)]|jgi:4-hydroxybenzoate polyprenyltransferase/phosphoserine phosphatase|nr:UbiA family prenyltransferase [Paracoccus sp. (in: a-proteobacteria)]